MLSRFQLQRSLSDTRGTLKSGTANWPVCQECLHHSRMVFVCQNTLVILCSINLNKWLLPFLGHSFSRCFFRRPRIFPKLRGWSQQSIFHEVTSIIQLYLSGGLFTPVTWELFEDHCHILWIFLLQRNLGDVAAVVTECLRTPLSLGAAAAPLLN